jgi:hypothetical protein
MNDRVSLDAAAEAMMLTNSYTRMTALHDLFFQMEREQWLRLLGDWWSICDDIGRHRSWLRIALPRLGPVRELMTPEEQAAWDALPQTVTIYRGARSLKLGVSWSLDRDVAAHFPFDLRYRLGGDPVLITARVRKRDILAIKLDRQEFEAIVFRGRRIVSREPLPELASA